MSAGKRKFCLIRLLIFFIFVFIKTISAQPIIDVVYPKEGDHIIASDSSFIFGRVWPKSSQLFINGKRARIYSNGSFLGVVPVNTGKFTFHCRAEYEGERTIVKRRVYIPHYLKSSPFDSLVIDTSYVFPREDWELRPGEVIKVAVKGTPGCQATFSIEGLTEDLPMVELSPKKSFYWGEPIFGQGTNFQMPEVKGIYTGSYQIQPWDWANSRMIRFKLINSNGDTIRTTAVGRLSIDLSTLPKIIQLTEDINIARLGPQPGYQLFLPRGVKILMTGKRGEHLRIRLSEDMGFWIRQHRAEILPPGSSLPEGFISEVCTESGDKWTTVKVAVDQMLPFKIQQLTKPTRLLVTFFGAVNGFDDIKVTVSDPLIRQLLWKQESEKIYTLQIDLNQKQHWGYDPYYEKGAFYLKLKKRPQIAGWPNSPLKDIVICLDPGHSPDDGAVGPTGVKEKDANYTYCVALKDALEKKGAYVVLTRGKEDGIGLTARIQLAAMIEADILLSFHFNALPDGVDPFKERGISTYYFHPQSYRLAYYIHQNLLRETRKRNFGLHRNSLIICRAPQMLSVLVEPGFIIHPIGEMLITSESYKQKVVNGIVKALEQYIKESR